VKLAGRQQEYVKGLMSSQKKPNPNERIGGNCFTQANLLHMRIRHLVSFSFILRIAKSQHEKGRNSICVCLLP